MRQVRPLDWKGLPLNALVRYWRPIAHRRRPAAGLRPCRLLLECLEGRCLLSGGFAVTNLASDVPGLARVTDPNLVNPWGISFSPTGSFWFSDNGSGVSDLVDGTGRIQPLVVAIPSSAGWAGPSTGTVFSGGSGFRVSEGGKSGASRFLFATEDGTISGWNLNVDRTHAILAVDNSPQGAVYKGLALADDGIGHTFLYAANFHSGSIDVFDENFQPASAPGAFLDPNLPAGFAPFNIQDIDGRLFVTYAPQAEGGLDNSSGPGQGLIDVYSTDGTLLQRFATGGALNAPWGMALAPARFGAFGGALLVGNTGDGHINAYDPTDGAFLGTLTDLSGAPLTFPNLWGLAIGNGHFAGPSNALFFTEGLDAEQHGLFGMIYDPSMPLIGGTTGILTYDPDAAGDDYPLPPDTGPTLAPESGAALALSSELVTLQQSTWVLAPVLSAGSVSPRSGDQLRGSDGSAVVLPYVTALPASPNPGTVRAAGERIASAATPGYVLAGIPLELDGLLDQSSAGYATVPSAARMAAAGLSTSEAPTKAGTISPPEKAEMGQGPVADVRGPMVSPAENSEVLPVEPAGQRPVTRRMDFLGKLVVISVLSSHWYYLTDPGSSSREDSERPGLGSNGPLR